MRISGHRSILLAMLVDYPDGHHGGWPESAEKDYLVRIVAWFDHYLVAE